MTIDQLIALGASAGAFLSAFATFLTVREMAKQRRAAQRPELVLSGVDLRVGSDDPYRAVWFSSPQSEESSPFVNLPLRNVGQGSAREITVNWDCDLGRAVALVNDYAQRTLIPLFLRLDGEAVLNFYWEQEPSGFSEWRNQKTVKVDHVLPQQSVEPSRALQMPHAYCQLVSCLLFLRARASLDERVLASLASEDLEASVGPLVARIDYTDVDGEKFSRAFSFEMEVMALNIDKDMGSYLAYGSFIAVTQPVLGREDSRTATLLTGFLG